jgi:hypothetical protein
MGGCYTTAQGGDTMDINSTIVNEVCFRQIYNTKKCVELIKNNQCFYCKKPGHHTNVYWKKITDKAKQGQEGTTSQPPASHS